MDKIIVSTISIIVIFWVCFIPFAVIVFNLSEITDWIEAKVDELRARAEKIRKEKEKL